MIISAAIAAAAAPIQVRLSSDNSVFVVSPDESDAVAAVVGRPLRHAQPNQPSAKGCFGGTDEHCRFVGGFHQSQVQSDLGQDFYKVLGSPPVVIPAPPRSVADLGLGSGGGVYALPLHGTNLRW